MRGTVTLTHYSENNWYLQKLQKKSYFTNTNFGADTVSILQAQFH